jgi:hypothetical protein
MRAFLRYRHSTRRVGFAGIRRAAVRFGERVEARRDPAGGLPINLAAFRVRMRNEIAISHSRTNDTDGSMFCLY